ncbi:hypothetical protein QYF61_027624 [Mycteria americana]|uniref:Uncharacterized protein n=1 Tax=Mycteria americana TaxID=33587 RepID=A0AAN7RYI5_MYCAM|nr:hypothetical protein QYF61_027624 [Mycteria americana]
MMIMASWVQPDLDCSPLLLELLKAVVLGVLVAALTAAQKYKCTVEWVKRDASESSQDSGKSLQAELEAEREKWVRSEIRLQNQLRDAFVRERELRWALAEARREDLVSECGRCGLFKERELADRGVAGRYPWEEMERAKCQHDERTAPQLRPLTKTEFQYEGGADTAPEIITKEIPYSATELVKLHDGYSRLPRETETEYVWRVSLTGEDRIKLSEEEAHGYWGPGVFLTVPDTRAPWSLTQRAGGLDPLERGDPVTIPTPGLDQITESVQKAACLQLLHDRHLTPHQPSPMLLKADPSRMKTLVKGLPDPLKLHAIQIQDRLRAALPIQERLTEMLTPRRSQTQSTLAEFPLTWGGVAQELISYSCNVGISGGEQRELLKAVVLGVLVAALTAAQKYKCTVEWVKRDASESSQDSGKSLQAELEAEREKWVRSEIRLQNQLRDAFVRERELRWALAEARREDLVSECGRCGLFKERELADRGVAGRYPWEEMERAKCQHDERTAPQLCPLTKTEFQYEGGADTAPEIITKEIPYSATELVKLHDGYSRLPRETETEYVWRVSLTGEDRIKLSEEEAHGYWGPGVFLTVPDTRAPWSLTQRAGGLDPLERGDPVTIPTPGLDQITESVQKAACLQLLHDRHLTPHQPSPMLLKADPSRMKTLVKGLPDPLKLHAIQIQDRLRAALPIQERLTEMLTPRRSQTQSTLAEFPLTWGGVAQELISYSCNVGISGGEQRELLKAVVLGVLVAALTAAQKYKCTVEWVKRDASESSQDSGKSLQAELEAEREKWVRSEIRLQNQLRDAFVRERELRWALAEARREDLVSECGRCGLFKERELADRGVAGRYPWEEMERAKCQHDERTAPQLRPLTKTEFQYEGGADTAPEIITKEIPYSATELVKLHDGYSRLPRETETEYVWRVSLTGEDRIKLSEEEAHGYWGPGVFLTVPDTRAPWSLTQRAGGLDPLERGDPVTIPTPGLDQITESVQKAACLQLLHDRHLTPHQPSPMLLKADPSRMKTLVKGLPDPLKLHAIQIQDRLRAALPIQERLTEMLTPRRSQTQSTLAEFPLTWGGVAQELISYSCNVGISGGEQRELLKAVVLGVLVAALTAAQKYKCTVEWVKRDASESSQDSGKSLQAELEAEREKWVRSEIRLQNQLRDAFVRERELRWALAEARREDLVSECGRCGLFKERELADRGVAGRYPWEEMERAKCQHDERTAPQLRPLTKTEFQYEGGADTAPEIITKEIPYSATELVKLHDGYSRLPRETETEYVWRVSLTGEDRIKLSEEEAHGYWGPGVFLTVPDTRAPWSLTQRAGGLDPLERGDPVTIPTPGLDQITESVQKAACLQLLHDRHLTPHQPSPMLLKADPSRMKTLVKGLPDPLKLHAIQIQDRLRAALPIQERLTEMLTPRRSQTQSTLAEFPLTWGGVAQELISYSCNVGISGGEQRELLKAVVLGVLVAALTAAQKYKCTVEWVKRDASESSQDSGKSLQAELEAEREKWVRSEIRLQNQLRDAFVRERELRWALAEARREDLVSECGRCGLFKERELADRGVAGRYPWEEMERAKCQHDERTAPQLRPLTKTEFQYEGGADTAPEIITKEIPYSATELVKLHDGYSRLPRETETEYVWRVSLTGEDRIKLSEEEAHGYWGPGVFLTVPDTRAPWSLTQRAGGLDPLERGDPVTIPTPGLDQITESVQKAACLQLLHDRHLTPHQPSPMLLKADPSRMKTLVKGLPDPLKLHAIQIQDRLRAALPIQERLTEMLTPRRSQTQSTLAEFPLTWGGVAQELISYSCNVGISGGEQRELLKAVVLGVLVAALTAAQKYKCTVEWVKRDASESSQDSGKSLQAELEAEREKWVRSEIRLQNQLRDAFVRERELRWALAEARREDLVSECGRCGLFKERELADRGVAGRYPWEEMERAKCQHDERTAPQLRPLTKTEFQYEGGADTAPEIITKEIPYSATELVKLHDGYSRLPRETETEYVWRVSLTGEDRIKLSEEEAHGYWGPGVFLTVPDTRAPWSLTQRAGGLDPLERGDPVTIPTPGLDQITESVQKAACLQLLHDRHLTPHQPSPMLLKADPSRMKTLVKGLPDPLKLHAIQIQDHLRAALPIQERLTEMLTPRRSQTQSTLAEFPLTWGGVAQELISYSCNVGISGGEQRELLKAVVLGVLVAALTAAQKYKCTVEWVKRDASESSQDSGKSLQAELEAEREKWVRSEIRLQNQLRDAFVRERELRWALAEARREDLVSECGRCGLFKERELADRGVAGRYPWEEMERAKCQHDERTAPQLRPLTKTEFQYEGGADTAPEIITKEIPYSATELVKLHDGYSRLPRETETEYVWRVSLTGEDRIKLSEEEAHGYWGPGVFLTVPDTRAPWSLTQRAGGLDPLERGDPVTIPTPGLDQITESVQKAACLQLLHDRHLTPHQPSPMLLKADPSRMKTLVKGLPDPLKLHAIQIQDHLRAALPIQERLTEMLTPRRSQTQSTLAEFPLTWGGVAQELISYSCNVGISGGEQRESGVELTKGYVLPFSNQPNKD